MTTLSPPADITIVVATDNHSGIGIRNTLPWHLPEDLAHFKRTTSGHPIIMGRKTFDSIGRPLPNRRNIVVTRNATWQHDNVDVASSLEAAIALVGTQAAFIIGGAQIYQEALPLVNRIIITRIDYSFDCDAHFPAIDPAIWTEVAKETHHSEKNGWDYAFVTLEKVKSEG
jgi:dihydrofolate reductase